MSFYPRSLIAEGVPWQATLKAYYHLHQAVARAAEFDVVHTHLSSTADMFLVPADGAAEKPRI